MHLFHQLALFGDLLYKEIYKPFVCSIKHVSILMMKPVFVLDGRSHILDVNPRTEQLFSYYKHELLGRPVENLPPEQLRERRQACRDCAETAARGQATSVRLDLAARRKHDS